MKKHINYLGWIGYENLGDEAIYLANKKMFPNYNLVYKNKLFDTNVSLFGGGTIFPDWAFGAEINKYNFAFGVGVRDPLLWGAAKKTHIEAVKKCRFKFLGVRGYVSQNILKMYGISSTVIGDPALSLEPHSYNKTVKNKVIINVGIPGGKMWGDRNTVLKEMVSVCKYLKQKKYEVIIVPFWAADIKYCSHLAKQSGVQMYAEWNNVQKTIDFISDSYAVIGEKLHSVIFSATSYTPFISLGYEPKCYEFCHSIGMQNNLITTDHLNAKKIIHLFKMLEMNRLEIQKKIQLKVNNFRRTQKNAAKSIQKEIDQLTNSQFYSRNKYLRYFFDGLYKNYLKIKYQ